MKKVVMISLAVVVLFASAIVSHKVFAGKSIENKTYSHLESVGYAQEDIEDIEIKHSFVNKVLGYNEWRIFVEFEKEPDIIFAFTYRDDQIMRQGITSHVTQLSKEEIYEYDRKFDNGELKNRS